MSDSFLCELLGPAWITTAKERRVIHEQLDQRGVICGYGRIVGYRQESQEPGKAPKKPEKAPKVRPSSSGTGFFITSDGYMLTSQHVVNDCMRIRTKTWRGELTATRITGDPVNDLALLKTGSKGPFDAATFRSGKRIRVGEEVIVVGYPLGELLGTSIKASVGTVSALTGIRNNTSVMQITAPLQPGNSGGPLLDASGNVVGIVSAKLNELAVLEATGTLSQNVNFAVKSSSINTFLNVTRIQYRSSASVRKLDRADVVERARKFTALVDCEN